MTKKHVMGLDALQANIDADDDPTLRMVRDGFPSTGTTGGVQYRGIAEHSLCIVDPLTGGEDTVEDGDPTPWLGPSDQEWWRSGSVVGG